MTIIIVNRECTTLFADVASTVDGVFIRNEEKIWRCKSGMIVGTTGSIETRAMRDAQTPEEFMEAVSHGKDNFSDFSALILWKDRCYQAVVNKKDGPLLLTGLGGMAIGKYSAEWQNYARARVFHTDSDIMFRATARTFCKHVSLLWGPAIDSTLHVELTLKGNDE